MKNDFRTLSGEVADVFAHRFVVATADGRVLADLGPEGATRLALKVGDAVTLTGEMTPSELKVSTLTRPGGEPIAIRRGERGSDAGPEAALRTAEAEGFAVVGEPRRRPKHFEITGRNAAGDLFELHVDTDGTLRKSKPLRAG